MNRNSVIKEAAAATPDPERAANNLERLFKETPELFEDHAHEIDAIAGLFAYSQFLADFSIRNPSRLFRALRDLHVSIEKQTILSEASDTYASFRDEDHTPKYKQNAIKLLREIKKYYLLIITMKDISGITDLHECMSELSILSESILALALDMSFTLMRRKFGLLRENPFSLIGMGKLGAGELNYSSDIDIITVYQSEKSVSTGVLNPFGIRYNKISSHEYFCTLTETLVNLLQSLTEDGIAYRVDLRLRPNGQKGALSLPLDSYISYYEAWGKTWERIALIRTRPVAGDSHLGELFLRAVEPFVWKRSVDYNDIGEIRELKKKIDTLFDISDIKRGYGGIREIEFFVQTFQLLYGGERKNLRKPGLAAAVAALASEGFLSPGDVTTLSESYLFLRRIEHLLQMRNDMQTHSLPSQQNELTILAKKMRFRSEIEFTAELKLMRLKVRDMYNSLLGAPEARREDVLALKDELPENAILDYLSFKGFKDPVSALKNLNTLHENLSVGKTLRERTLLRKTIPVFLDQVMKSVQRDRALSMLSSFLQKIGNHESYIDLLFQRNDTREIVVTTFSTSTYLTRLLLGLENLEGIFEYPDIRMDFRSLQERLSSTLSRDVDPLNAIREFKIIEELKSGLLFLKGFLDSYAFSHTLSMLADTIIRAIAHYLKAGGGFAVIGLGGFGARDLNIGSDLDLIFISSRDRLSSTYETSPAEKMISAEFIRCLSEYTSKGFAYRVDMRLRPDGARGILVNDIEGYETYYLSSARPWEIQSLLRARPVAGDMNLLRAFQLLRRKVIMQRGREVRGTDIRDMRRRIVREVSRESSGYDLKNGPGGIKEIEFMIQYLQLKHAAERPDLVTHHTVSAFKRLSKYAILDEDTRDFLFNSYSFLRTVDTLLRMNEEDVLQTDSDLIDILTGFLNIRSKDEFMQQIEDIRKSVLEITERFYVGFNT
jgi:glutamate-ammonia-ligase adenylyltransferase